MNRRNFILFTVAGGAITGAGGLLLLGSDSSSELLTIDSSLRELDKLVGNQITTLGDWNLAQIFVHCAQSVEFSMSGFPEQNSAFFKSTIGPMAFAVFSARGEMAHSLSEGIPGASLINEDEDVSSAYRRFRDSMIAFKNYKGQLAPHFAYGDLTKKEYERAHAMHFYNHLAEIRVTA